MSDDVTITDVEGSLWVDTPYSGLAILPPRAVAALRARFAAERMPKDVQALAGLFRGRRRDQEGSRVMDDATQKLVDEARRAQKAVYLATDKSVADDLSRIIAGLADALEAAYSQKGADNDSR